MSTKHTTPDNDSGPTTEPFDAIPADWVAYGNAHLPLRDVDPDEERAYYATAVRYVDGQLEVKYCDPRSDAAVVRTVDAQLIANGNGKPTVVPRLVYEHGASAFPLGIILELGTCDDGVARDERDVAVLREHYPNTRLVAEVD